MARGGKRHGSGRKRDPAKDIRLSQAEAEKLLRDLEKRRSLVEIYATCGDARLQAHINLKIREHAWGKPTERTEIGGRDGNPIQIGDIKIMLVRPK